MTVTSNGSTHATYGGVYRAVCLEVLPDRARVQIPQLFATATVTVFEFAGGRPAAGDDGWVAFEGELAEHPIWIGSESKGGGGGVAAYPPYYAFNVNVSYDSVSGGTRYMTLLDGTVKATYDGWVEIIASGGYAGMSSTGPVNVRQGLVCPDLHDPTSQAWTSVGRMASPAPATWDLIGDCEMNIPVVKDQAINAQWVGQWTPTSYQCSFRSFVSVKFFSAELLGDGSGGAAGGGAAHGLPPGGATGQALVKASASDYDATWVTIAGAIASYRHIQTVAAAVWTIPHNLGFYPNVAVVDSSGREVVGEIDYVDMNTVRLTFSAAFGGEAYLS
jgi:hypothetical protein